MVIGAPGGTQITMGGLAGADERAGLRDVDVGRGVGGTVLCATSNPIDVSNRIPRFVTRELEAQGV